jgi:hypothetical protein
MALFICIKCGYCAPCVIIAALHQATWHSHRDVCISEDLRGLDDEDVARCLPCLLDNTIPLEDYYRMRHER